MIKSKTGFLTSIALLTVLILTGSEGNGQTTENPRELLDKKITFVLNDINQELVLKSFARKSGIPLGFYRVRPIDHNSPLKISIRVVDGKVRDILEQFVRADPRYTWLTLDGVVNIVPVDMPLVLRTCVRAVDFRDIDIDDLGAVLLGLPEVQSVLEVEGLSNSKIRVSYGSRKQGESVSVRSEGGSVQEILNSRLRKKDAQFWVTEYSGARSEYLSIVLF